MKQKYLCKKCNKFVAEVKEDGDIEINPKSKKIFYNKNEFKIICKCGEQNNLKL